MKIYFAGSIRGARSDAELYQRIIKHLQQTDTVLTEHVGDLSLSVLERGVDRDVQIYERDIDWLRQSDIVIAECTSPSLGVGYELAFAEKLNIPVHIFYNSIRCHLSAMLKGNQYFHIHPYESEQAIYEELSSIISNP